MRHRWRLRWAWPPVCREPREASKLAAEAEQGAVRVHTEVIIPLREMQKMRDSGDHLPAAIQDDMTRRRPPTEGGAHTHT